MQEVSEINLHAVSVEQAGCSSVSDIHGDVTADIDKSEGQSGVEYVCEVNNVAQAISLEVNMDD